MSQPDEQEKRVPARVPPLQNPVPRLRRVPKVVAFRLGNLLFGVSEEGSADLAEPPHVDQLQRRLQPAGNLLDAKLLVIVGPLTIVAEEQQLVLRLDDLVDVVSHGDRVRAARDATDSAPLFAQAVRLPLKLGFL